MLGSMFTADAKETEATARKTTKTAVNLLSMLSMAFSAFLRKRFFLRAGTFVWAGKSSLDWLGTAEVVAR